MGTVSKVTEYTENCLICGTPTTEYHHLVFGRAYRRLADKDKLLLPICNDCHRELHDSKVGKALSRMLGQAIYEKEHTREEFRKRYGISYL